MILAGQFFKEVNESGAAVAGWTVVNVETGKSTLGSGETRGPIRVIVVRNDRRTAAPHPLAYKTLLQKIEDARWLPVGAPLKRAVPTPLDPKKAEHIEKQERAALATIQPILDLGREQYFEHIRTPVLKEIAKSRNINPNSVWQLLCLYWQFGNSSVGLRSRRSLAGQKSLKQRIKLSEERDESKRIPFKTYKTGPTPGSNCDSGKQMTLTDVKLCRKAAKRFLFVPSADHKLRLQWTYAHDQTLTEFYDRESNPSNPAPSLDQFEHAIRTDPEFHELTKKIIGESHFLLSGRERRSVSSNNIGGPGLVGQIDDVTTKVILVDPVSLMPLGQGRFFVVVDNWCGIIAGAHDTVSTSNFDEAAEGLINAFLPKSLFSQESGIDLDPRFVPCMGVFKNIVADGGPLGGSLPNYLPARICNISNPTGYRGDQKSDVETSFHAYLLQVASRLPGYSRKKRCRGEDDPKIVAYLTPKEFRAIFWAWIQLYNQRVLKKWLPPEVELHPNPPERVPYKLWSWGLEECGGHLMHRSEEELRRALLRHRSARLTPKRTVEFEGLTYVLDKAELAKVRQHYPYARSSEIVVFYATNYVRQIYFECDGELLIAKLRPDLVEIFGDVSFHAAKHRMAVRRKKSAPSQKQYNQARRTTSEKIRKICAGSLKNITEVFKTKAKHAKLAAKSSLDLARERVLNAERKQRTAKNAKAFPPDVSEQTNSKPIPEVRRLTVAELLVGNGGLQSK